MWPQNTAVHTLAFHSSLVMSISNQEFGIPRKYQYQIAIWYLCLKFLGIFWVFYRNLEDHLVKSWLLVFFGRIKSVWYLVSVVAISLVSVWFRFVIFLKVASLFVTDGGCLACRYDLTDELRTQTDTRQLELWSQEDIVSSWLITTTTTAVRILAAMV